jgi:dinuclear metal center YbgI/SA1388 family protein
VKATIADIIKIMESVAPSRLAEEWDNVGLQIGDRRQMVESIRVALDPTPDVVAAASKDGVDLLITHHPLIFHPLKRIDLGTPTGFIIQTALKHRLAIYSAHTNLDSAMDGLNDILASRIGLNDLEVLGNAKKTENYKLVFYIPSAYEQAVMRSLFETNAGEIENYTCCSFRNKGEGTYKAGPLSKPFSGEIGEISRTGEVRIETVVRKDDVTSVVDHVKKNHPYETMAYDIYPLLSYDGKQGLGRIGTLDKSMDLRSFALSIKTKLGLSHLKVAGNSDLTIKKVAVCSGSGSSLIKQFVASGAQVYVSGDLGYHDARTAEALNLGIIDIGHFASEHLIVDALVQRLKRILSEAGVDIKIEAYKLEHEPFLIL